MTARMIRFDEEYTKKLEEFIAASNGHIELIDDPNLIDDPYFYERKASLTNTIKSIDNGSMKTMDFNSSIDTLIAKYGS